MTEDLNVPDPKQPCVTLPAYQVVPCPSSNRLHEKCPCKGLLFVRVDPEKLPIWPGHAPEEKTAS